MNDPTKRNLPETKPAPSPVAMFIKTSGSLNAEPRTAKQGSLQPR
jgi:hypothetical protein